MQTLKMALMMHCLLLCTDILTPFCVRDAPFDIRGGGWRGRWVYNYFQSYRKTRLCNDTYWNNSLLSAFFHCVYTKFKFVLQCAVTI